MREFHVAPVSRQRFEREVEPEEKTADSGYGRGSVSARCRAGVTAGRT